MENNKFITCSTLVSKEQITHPLYVFGIESGADAAILAALDESRINGVIAVKIQKLCVIASNPRTHQHLNIASEIGSLDPSAPGPCIQVTRR